MLIHPLGRRSGAAKRGGQLTPHDGHYGAFERVFCRNHSGNPSSSANHGGAMRRKKSTASMRAAKDGFTRRPRQRRTTVRGSQSASTAIDRAVRGDKSLGHVMWRISPHDPPPTGRFPGLPKPGNCIYFSRFQLENSCAEIRISHPKRRTTPVKWHASGGRNKEQAKREVLWCSPTCREV
jgi:hypothetical protein